MKIYHKNYRGNFITSHIRESLDFQKGQMFAWLAAMATMIVGFRLAVFLFS